MSGAERAVEKVFRDEYGRVVATLIRQVGDFELAEDAVQEAVATALATWPQSGIPRNPGAWLTTTARRKAIDRLRRAANYARKQEELRYLVELDRREQELPDDMMESALIDDRLRLIFTCCHPALSMEAQVALTLKTLGGLTTPEIARAFILAETTMAQRLVRAKRKIKAAAIPYRMPPDDQLPDRVESVLAVLYLIFNEGYSTSTGDVIVRRELCAEAIRLGSILCDLMPDEPEVLGLTALMMFQDSRRDAREIDGSLALLSDQDRGLWDATAIERASVLLDRAIRLMRRGAYQVQAAIASLHAAAPSAEETDWHEIHALYCELMIIQPSPVVALNKAVAAAMAFGPEAGLRAMTPLGTALDGYHLYHSARAGLLRRLGRSGEAADAYRRALQLVGNETERTFLESRLTEVG